MKDSEYEITVGLEIHAQLKTKTKLFCNSKNDADEDRPNVNICPVCMGHPGTLPVLNKEAVKKVIMVGLAVGGNIAEFTEFDRKHYFYPDIPKGYQISQYKHPLVSGGELVGVKITRIHLEEDTARSTHDSGVVDGAKTARKNSDYSLVDFNRAGVPLMELVTEPVIHSAVEAGRFARELQLLLQYLGVCDANLEKGEMRVEANISVAKKDAGKSGASAAAEKPRGTKVEVKNLNSFRAVEKSIEFEAVRHIELIENGEKVIQETRGWNEARGETFSQRLKEQSHDYRYFPDPDLPKLKISEISDVNPENLREQLPELPSARRARLKNTYGIKDEDVEMYVRDREWGQFFEDVTKFFSASGEKMSGASGEKIADEKKLGLLASNYISSDLAGLVKEKGNRWESAPISPEHFAKLIKMIALGDVSSRSGKDILKIMFESGGRPDEIANENDLIQKNDEGTILAVIEKILTENASVVAEYKSGKSAAFQFLIGQAMKATKGSANPEVLKKVLLDKLGKWEYNGKRDIKVS